MTHLELRSHCLKTHCFKSSVRYQTRAGPCREESPRYTGQVLYGGHRSTRKRSPDLSSMVTCFLKVTGTANRGIHKSQCELR
jgi:hypothetical protein